MLHSRGNLTAERREHNVGRVKEMSEYSLANTSIIYRQLRRHQVSYDQVLRVFRGL